MIGPLTFMKGTLDGYGVSNVPKGIIKFLIKKHKINKTRYATVKVAQNWIKIRSNNSLRKYSEGRLCCSFLPELKKIDTIIWLL